MTPLQVVVYDANVLFPAQLRDLLMRVAVAGLVRAHWSQEIHEEWMRSVLERHADIPRSQLERTRSLMDRALPDALVEGYEHRTSTLDLPDSDDRHVLAAAIEAGADAIVTFNAADFPPSALEPHDVSAVHPDVFMHDLYTEVPRAVVESMRLHRRSLRRPPKSRDEYLDILERAGLEQTVHALRVEDEAV